MGIREAVYPHDSRDINQVLGRRFSIEQTWRQIMDDSQFKTLMAVLARIADSLDVVIKLAEAINDRVDDCNDNLMSVSKNTW
jgi:hypothetical protein